MPDARCARSRAWCVENTRVSHHGHTGNTRHSPHDGFNGFLRALLGDRACLSPSPVRCGSIVTHLMPASGHQDHTTSPSATVSTKANRRSWYQSRRSFSEGGSAPLVSRHPASTASRPAFVTIAKRPPCRGGTVGISNAASTKRRSEIFFADGVDSGATQRGVICSIGKSGNFRDDRSSIPIYRVYGVASNAAYGPMSAVPR
jgi:hypothetical protein